MLLKNREVVKVVMHIIIGLITAIAGLVWALNRLHHAGVNINSFNPFFWLRRRRWEKQLGNKLIHGLEKPIDAASLLVVAIAKMDGVFTREQKSEIISLFESELKISNSAAAESFSASSYMLQDTVNIVGEVKNILKPSQDAFESHHAESLIGMLLKTATAEGSLSPEQSEFIAEVEKVLEVKTKQARW